MLTATTLAAMVLPLLAPVIAVPGPIATTGPPDIDFAVLQGFDRFGRCLGFRGHGIGRRFDADLAPFGRIRQIEAEAMKLDAFVAAEPGRQPDAE